MLTTLRLMNTDDPHGAMTTFDNSKAINKMIIDQLIVDFAEKVADPTAGFSDVFFYNMLDGVTLTYTFRSKSRGGEGSGVVGPSGFSP